jgi:hypothetical protein
MFAWLRRLVRKPTAEEAEASARWREERRDLKVSQGLTAGRVMPDAFQDDPNARDNPR